MNLLQKEVNNMFELVPWMRYKETVPSPGKYLFNWLFEDSNPKGLWELEREWLPAFDVSETDEEIIVKAELPGMSVEDIDVTLTDGLLTIKGERKMDKEDKGENYRRIERKFGSFSRSFKLGVEVKADTIDASYKDGILTLTLPKAEDSKPKRVEVKS
jgi:HSP20 family protein